MTFLEKQTRILEQLANTLFNAFNGEYDFLKSEYEFLPTFNTISTSISFEKNGITEYIEAATGVASKNLELCEELRSLMKAHTGGEWSSFTLTLDANGKAHTTFQYPEDQT